MNSVLTTEPGFYGKLPVYGDFIQKRLPRDFIQPWDQWLQTGLAAAKERLPQEWLTYYLNCPAWRFVLGDGVCGEQGVVGVTIPSVDRVGRYFNFTIASLLPPETAPAAFLLRNRDWMDGLEDLALNILGDELDQDAIDEATAALAAPDLDGLDDRPTVDHGDGFLRLSFDPSRAAGMDPIRALLHQLIVAQEGERYGLWWQSGSNQVAPQLLCSRGLPSTALFLDLMISTDAIDAPSSGGDEILDEFLAS